MAERSTRRHDLLTLVAIGVAAHIAADVVHEVLGHGVVCLLSGGKITLLTLVFFATSYFFSVPGAVLGARSFLKITPSFITKTTFSIALIF